MAVHCSPEQGSPGNNILPRLLCDIYQGPFDSGIAAEAGPIVECPVGSICIGGSGPDGGMSWECCEQAPLGGPIVLTTYRYDELASVRSHLRARARKAAREAATGPGIGRTP
jgi:hypothetical protein